jgi:hypothetical protein
MVLPVFPVMDFVASVQSYNLTFDAAGFQRDWGTPSGDVGKTSISPALFELRVHRAGDGLRPTGSLGIGLMDISRPSIFYTDGQGQNQTLNGVEIFALDPCYVVGGGLQWLREQSWLGGSIDAKFVVAPGRTTPAQTTFVVTTSLSVMLPRLH